MSDFAVEAYTNEFGQLLNPGDDVIYVGKKWGESRVCKGRFAGVYYKTWWNKDAPAVICALKVDNIPDRKWIWDRITKTGYNVDILRTAYLPLKRVYKLA